MKEDIFAVSGMMGRAFTTKVGKKTVSQNLFSGKSKMFGNFRRKTYDRQGLFLFSQTPGLRLEEKEEKTHQEQMMDLMYMHQVYHNIVQIRQYASRGSKLVCKYGTKPALLDTLVDHGVYIGISPVMTCVDCREWNIHNFGSCMSPEKFYEERLPMAAPMHPNGKQADIAPYNHHPHICIPLISPRDAWYQAETGVFLEETKGVAFQALKDDAFLVCQYGGIITIPEVCSSKKNEKETKMYVWCTKAIKGTEPVYLKNTDKLINVDEYYEFEQTNINLKTCFSGCSSRKCVDRQCGAVTDKNAQGDIEGGIWQEYEQTLPEDEVETVNSENSYMICTRGGGFIYFLNARQELLDIAEQFKEIVIYVTLRQLKALKWDNPTMETVIEMNKLLNKYEITTTERIRHFLAQCMAETHRGSWVLEGAYLSWSSQKEYEEHYNNQTKYGYKYRGAGYIQMTHEYNYLSCATYFIQQEYPELNIEWRSPNNTGEGFETRYKEAVRKAEEAGHNVDKYKKIVEEGADYAGKEFAWETAGYFWKSGNVNTLVDSLTPDNKDEVNKVTQIVNKYTTQDSYRERRDYYEETIAVIK